MCHLRGCTTETVTEELYSILIFLHVLATTGAKGDSMETLSRRLISRWSTSL